MVYVVRYEVTGPVELVDRVVREHVVAEGRGGTVGLSRDGLDPSRSSTPGAGDFVVAPGRVAFSSQSPSWPQDTISFMAAVLPRGVLLRVAGFDMGAFPEGESGRFYLRSAREEETQLSLPTLAVAYNFFPGLTEPLSLAYRRRRALAHANQLLRGLSAASGDVRFVPLVAGDSAMPGVPLDLRVVDGLTGRDVTQEALGDPKFRTFLEERALDALNAGLTVEGLFPKVMRNEESSFLALSQFSAASPVSPVATLAATASAVPVPAWPDDDDNASRRRRRRFLELEEETDLDFSPIRGPLSRTAWTDRDSTLLDDDDYDDVRFNPNLTPDRRRRHALLDTVDDSVYSSYDPDQTTVEEEEGEDQDETYYDNYDGETDQDDLVSSPSSL
ncbi:hypothetical protein ml_469 [Mollivirus sibericum]|uniref:hypothetical protein n=1 Tax=Mollivirus sibericum TaxID=1678078 RepID=UPI0006B2EA8C|nr:hypothetical protein ml_469 [Mollivirus sibericum]ALD62271.1 hypothetical protein ml_469 [Mollivirus sibericum]